MNSFRSLFLLLAFSLLVACGGQEAPVETDTEETEVVEQETTETQEQEDEEYITVESVHYVEGEEEIEGSIEDLGTLSSKPTIIVSFSNGVTRNFEENTEFFQLIDLDTEEPIDAEVRTIAFGGREEDNTRTMEITPVNELESGDYGILINQGFSANNGNTLEEDVLILFTVE